MSARPNNPCHEDEVSWGAPCPRCGNPLDWAINDKGRMDCTVLECYDIECGYTCLDDPDDPR